MNTAVNTKPSSGPCTIEHTAHGAWGIWDGLSRLIAQTQPEGTHDRRLDSPQRGDVSEANARLIGEAFDVHTETGLTPRQIALQRVELLEALKEALPLLREFAALPNRPLSINSVVAYSLAAIAKASGNA